MKLVTSNESRELDRLAAHSYNIPSLTLMENAGSGAADIIKERVQKNEPLIVFVGKGNNGGDGLVIARHLIKAGYTVLVAIMAHPDEFSADALVNWKKLSKQKPQVFNVTEKSLEKLKSTIRQCKYIVDAIFGTGLTKDVKGIYESVIKAINSSGRPVISVDIPSGLSADTGEALGVAVRSKLTITFGLPKVGQFMGKAHEYIKELKIINIGFPDELIEKFESTCQLITPELFCDEFKERDASSHKGSYGHLLTIAGSTGKAGSGWLASKAALRSGAGLATYAMPEAAFQRFDTRHAEVMVEPLPDKEKGRFIKESAVGLKELTQNVDVVAIGPGIGTKDETEEFVSLVVAKLTLPLIIDADGLNNIAGHLGLLDKRRAVTVLTPHPGEMERLTKQKKEAIQKDRLGSAVKFSVLHKVYLVLKGNGTVVATPEGRAFINPTGNPGMATAGSGDVLTGVVGAFLAQNMPAGKAVIAAVYVHGLAGDIAAAEKGEMGMIASDIIEKIPDALKIVRATIFPPFVREGQGG